MVHVQLYFNKAITYEDEAMETDVTDTHGCAYCYYKKAYVVSLESLDAEHNKTVRYRGILAQQIYEWFSNRYRVMRTLMHW